MWGRYGGRAELAAAVQVKLDDAGGVLVRLGREQGGGVVVIYAGSFLVDVCAATEGSEQGESSNCARTGRRSKAPATNRGSVRLQLFARLRTPMLSLS